MGSFRRVGFILALLLGAGLSPVCAFHALNRLVPVPPPSIADAHLSHRFQVMNEYVAAGGVLPEGLTQMGALDALTTLDNGIGSSNRVFAAHRGSNELCLYSVDSWSTCVACCDQGECAEAWTCYTSW